MDNTEKVYEIDNFEDYTVLLKTANLSMTLTESTVRFHDPETFRVLLTFAPYYETVREMSLYDILDPVAPCIATGLRIFHKAIESLPINEVTAYEILRTMSMVVPQRSIPCTASRWMAVLRTIGWEDGDLAAYTEELDASAWESA